MESLLMVGVDVIDDYKRTIRMLNDLMYEMHDMCEDSLLDKVYNTVLSLEQELDKEVLKNED
jgi:hypothetical protein